LSRPDFKATILTGSREIPMVQTPSADVVLTLDGRKLLDLPKSTAMPYTRDVEGLGYYYIASDGAVAILIGDATAARAFDLATCDQLWSLTGETQTQEKDVWRVNTTLVQRINDELFSLVAPS
jgi:hypothetical protein